MHRTGAFALLAAALTAAAISSPANAAAQVSVGPSKLCGEDGCFGGDKKTFTQVISAADHKGTVNISSLSLFRSVMGSMAGQNVKIIFELADGTEITWGRWTVGAMAGDEFVTIGGETINWDSALGDLKVRLELFKPEKGHAGSGWGWGAGGVENAFGGGDVGGGGGLVAPNLPFGDIVNTGPLVRPSLPPQPIVAVPEPGAWALMILGFGAAGAMLRRRKAYRPGFG
ncbi:PEPxxWA-CTERM sorting domain-containing protein [Phenylobacterium sp.]|uniref:PEPxxWA-CTERM sorting domain-containing protein n=1 Tax=Phenylobacterium sp. TaxID=1871053 RepID=UPI002EDB9B0C